MATLITKNSSTASAVPAAGDLVKGELAVNVTDKKVYTKDNSAAVVKLVGSLGNQEANAVAITGGAINGTTIGATTPSTGAFTTASASGGFTGNLTGNVTGNVSGTAANVTGVVAIANGGTGLSSLGTGVQSALGQAVTGSGSFVLSTSPSLTTPNLGTPSAAVLTNATGLPLTTGVTGTLGVANGGTGITAFGTGVATALGQNVTGSGGIVLATSPSLTTPNLGTPSAATLTNATGLPISTGVSGLGTGVATALAVNTGSAGAFVVNGGALGTPSSGTVTNLTGTASININGTVGATTPTTGAFTTLSASGNITVSGGTANGVAYLNGSKVLTTGSALTFDGTNFQVGSNASAGSIVALGGSAGATIAITPSSASGANGVVYNTSFVSGGSGPHIWQIGGSEQARLTTTGLGIGTSSPLEKLQVNGAILTTGSLSAVRTSAASLDFLSGNTRFISMGADASTKAGFIWYNSTNAAVTEAMRLDSSGNLGLGVTPSAWNITALQVKNGSMYGAGSTEAGWYSNAYYNSGWKYIANGASAGYVQNGNHQWFVAGSGTAGNAISFTQAMTLDASGNLLVGTTTAATTARIDGLSSSGGTPAIGAKVTAGAATQCFIAWNDATTGDNVFHSFYTEGGSGTLRGSIDYNRAGGLTRYNITSDYRAKDIIGPVQNTGTTIDALKVYEGVMKGATQARPMMIAHEAQEVVPFCVSGAKDETNEDGTPKYQQMDHASLVPLLIAELQSLRARVAQLEAK